MESKCLVIVCLFLMLLQNGCKKSATESDPLNETGSSITITSLSPAAGSVVSSLDTIRADLAYVIADDEVSDYGFAVSVKFQSVIENQTLSLGEEAMITVSDKKGQVNLVYPLTSAWRSSDLAHPVSCFFYLHNYVSETTSSVIAKTERISYEE